MWKTKAHTKWTWIVGKKKLPDQHGKWRTFQHVLGVVKNPVAVVVCLLLIFWTFQEVLLLSVDLSNSVQGSVSFQLGLATITQILLSSVTAPSQMGCVSIIIPLLLPTPPLTRIVYFSAEPSTYDMFLFLEFNNNSTITT